MLMDIQCRMLSNCVFEGVRCEYVKHPPVPSRSVLTAVHPATLATPPDHSAGTAISVYICDTPSHVQY
jgi:hypothetical protein